MAGLKETFVTQLTDVNSTAQEPLGSLRFHMGNKVYKYVDCYQTSGTVTCVVGDQVLYRDNSAAGPAANQVCINHSDAVTTYPIAAGIAAGAHAGVASTHYYMWIQIKGPATLSTSITSGAAGQGFVASATDKTFTVTTAGSLVPMAGVAANSTTSVILDCPF